MKHRIAVLFGVLFFGGLVRGDFIEDWKRISASRPEGYVCARAKGAINIDGKLDEADWAAAPWTHDFQDIEGKAKPTPRFRTRAKMLWDGNYFYVAAELEEPHVWGTLTNHDAVIFQDPDFEVFIDPDGDRHNYYEFEMNALNTTWDLLLKKPYIDGGPALNEWEIKGLQTAVHVNGTLNNASDKDRGWQVEIAFPWKALAEYSKQPTPPHEGDIWRVDFSRVEWQIDTSNGTYRKIPNTREDNWVWSPTGIVDMHRPEEWGLVKFVSQNNGKPFRPLEDVPRYAVLDYYYSQKEFNRRTGRWAKDVGELGRTVGARFRGASVSPRTTPEGFEVFSKVKKDDALWQMRQDGLLLHYPARPSESTPAK
jgi:hypothetical protein